MRLKSDNIAWMKNILKKFTTPGNLVVEAFAEVISVSNAYLLFPKQCRLTEYEVDPSCVTEVKPQLILINIKQVLREKLDIDGDEHVCTSAKVYAKKVEAIDVHKSLNVWEVLEEYLPMQTISPHILYHLSTYIGKEELSGRA